MNLKNHFRLFYFLLFFLQIIYCYAQQSVKLKAEHSVIHYKLYGSAGKTLLMFNGGPGYSSTRLHEVATELSKNFRVVLFDQRGTGESLPDKYDSTTINLNEYLKDVEAIRENLNLSSWMVAGHSFGGLLAMSYAAKFPKRIDKLLLISSAGLNLNFLTSFQDNIVNIIGGDTLKYQLSDDATAEDFYFNIVSINSPAYVFNKTNVELVRSRLTDKATFSIQVNQLMWRDLFAQKFDLTSPLKTFDKKTLILQGAQDIVGMETAFETHAAIKTSTVSFIRRCGHLPWLDRPAEFYSKVNAFLKN